MAWGFARYVDRVARAGLAALWSGADIPDRAGPFDRSSPGGTLTAFTTGGTGWYRKRFTVPDLPPEGRVEVLFDGVYMNSDVWLNGHPLGNHPNGYTPFFYDLTPHLNPAGENVLAVRVRNEGQNSRWYSGSGIYRPVKLAVTGPVRFRRWGTTITTPQVGGSAARVDVVGTIEGARPGATLIARLFDPAGSLVAERRSSAAAEPSLSIPVRSPRLWSPESPALYRLDLELRSGDTVHDRTSTAVGIRAARWPAPGCCPRA